MPIMDGYITTYNLNCLSSEQIIDKPIIIGCTAYVDLKTKTKCYDLGMSYFITKPINRDQIKQLLDYYKIIW